MLTLYGIAFTPALKPYRTGPLFIDKNGDSGADFCNEAKLRRAYLKSHIGYGVHTILNSFSCWHKRRSSVVWTYSLSLVNLLCENALVSFGLYVYKLLESNSDWCIFCLHLSWVTRGENTKVRGYKQEAPNLVQFLWWTSLTCHVTFSRQFALRKKTHR